MPRSIKYPSNRRSPTRHHVDGYTRNDGVKISGYFRGSGTGQPINRSKLVKGERIDDSTEGGPEAWQITFKYGDGKQETVTVIAPSYEKAMDEAFEERRRQKTKPVAITIVDPSLWGAIKGVAKGVGKVAKAGGKRAKFTVKKHVIMGLLKDAYSDNKVKQMAARIALKQEYPSVYQMCDFSRERGRTYWRP